MKNNRWYMAAIGVLLLLWLQAEYRLWRINAEIAGIYQGVVTIKAVDADTKEPLQIGIQTPGTTLRQRWPKVTIRSTDDTSEVRVQWLGTEPVEFGVSSEGYAEQRLKLDQHSNSHLVVELQRKPAAKQGNGKPS
jgi:hypothetical protein